MLYEEEERNRIKYSGLSKLSVTELCQRFGITEIDHNCEEDNCKEKSKKIQQIDPRHHNHFAHFHYMTSIKAGKETPATQRKDKNAEAGQEEEKEK